MKRVTSGFIFVLIFGLLMALIAALLAHGARAEDQLVVVELVKDGRTQWVVPSDGGRQVPSGKITSPQYSDPGCGAQASGASIAGLPVVMWAWSHHPGWAVASWRCMAESEIDGFLRAGGRE